MLVAGGLEPPAYTASNSDLVTEAAGTLRTSAKRIHRPRSFSLFVTGISSNVVSVFVG